ncbi:MAG: septum formation initiator family protein [Verrucomicrobiae bacterium]|nr:septum formation initiator family protein [Verrucomicrobiae bacterium]
MSQSTNHDEVSLGLWGYANRLLMVLIVLSLIAAAGLSYLPLIQQNRKLRMNLQEVRVRYEQYASEVRELQAQVLALQRDPKAVERAARELGMARPGEIIVKFEPAGR